MTIIDLSKNVIPSDLVTIAKYEDIYQTIKSIPEFTQYALNVLDYIYRFRLKMILTHHIDDEKLKLIEHLDRITNKTLYKRKGKIDINVLKFIKIWEAYIKILVSTIPDCDEAFTLNHYFMLKQMLDTKILKEQERIKQQLLKKVKELDDPILLNFVSENEIIEKILKFGRATKKIRNNIELLTLITNSLKNAWKYQVVIAHIEYENYIEITFLPATDISHENDYIQSVNIKNKDNKTE